MEIPPVSSFSQASALFSDLNQEEIRKHILGVYPTEPFNKQIDSADRQQAVSHTGLDKEFRTEDYHEAHRLYNGPLQYPYQNKAQIFNHKFDPFYWDGTELSDNYNVQENLIGTPLGASTLEDPRLAYVHNMLLMRELHGANDPLENDYIKQLYMVNVEKGSNYYQNQLDKLDSAMSNYTRQGRFSKSKPLQDIQFTQSVATGNPTHYKHTAKINIQQPSEFGLVQRNRRASRMRRVDALTAPYNMHPMNPVLRQTNPRNNGNGSVDLMEYGPATEQQTQDYHQSWEETKTADFTTGSHLRDTNMDDLPQTNLVLPTLGTPTTTAIASLPRVTTLIDPYEMEAVNAQNQRFQSRNPPSIEDLMTPRSLGRHAIADLADLAQDTITKRVYAEAMQQDKEMPGNPLASPPPEREQKKGLVSEVFSGIKNRILGTPKALPPPTPSETGNRSDLSDITAVPTAPRTPISSGTVATRPLYTPQDVTPQQLNFDSVKKSPVSGIGTPASEITGRNMQRGMLENFNENHTARGQLRSSF
jgi:hypothetical protein